MKKILALTLTLLLLVGFFAPQAMAWGVKTHNYAARLIVEELKELKSGGTYRLKLPPYDGVFSVPNAFGDAITRYPQAFYAGSLGPDLYPDLFAGPNWVHDGDSMPWVKTMIDRVNSMPAGAQKEMAMAFTLGFMSHYCADMFGSDYLTSMAYGQRYSSLPLANALHATPAIIVYVRNMALRTGLDERINDTYNKTDVKAPVDFVMQNLIYNGAINNGISDHYKEGGRTVPVQFGYLVSFRSIIHTVSETVKKVPALGAAASIFTENWINQFDKAVVKYVEASNVIAQRILLSHASDISETHIFVEEISEWVENYGATISPIPKIGGGDKDNNKGILDKVKSMVLNLVSKAFGYKDFKTLVVDVVFKVFDGFDTAISNILKTRFPSTKVDSFYAMLKEPGRPLFDSDSVLSDFARDAAVLKADSAAGTGAADQNLVPLYNSLTMMKLMLIGPENYQALLKGAAVDPSSVTSAYQSAVGPVNVNRIRITIHTANEKYAGTDDNIYLHISDDNGKTYKNKVLLDKPNYDDFERNATDSYDVDLGADISLDKLRFKLENSYVLFKDDWKVGWVEITPYMGSAPISKASNGRISYNAPEAWLTNKNKTLTLRDFFKAASLSYSSPLHAGILPQQLWLDGTRQWRYLQFWDSGVENSEMRKALFFTLFKGYSPKAGFTLKSGNDPVDQTINIGDTLTIDAQLINRWNGVPATRRAQTKLLANAQSDIYKMVTGKLTYTFISSDGGSDSEFVTIDPPTVILKPVQQAPTLSYKVLDDTYDVGDTIRIIATYEGDNWNAPATYEVATLRVVNDHQYALNVENGTIDNTNGATTGLYQSGAEISVTADKPQENTYFVGWEGEGIDLTDAQKAQTTLEMIMPHNDVTVTARYEVVPEGSDSTEYYALSVVNGKGSGVFEEGDKVTVTADAAGSDEEFVGWESNGVELTAEQKKQTTLTFDMPGNDVVITACYEIKPNGQPDKTNYRVSVIHGTGDGLYAPNAQVTVEADIQPGRTFIGWESEDISLTPEQRTQSHLTFTMPENDVTLIACYATTYRVSVINGTGGGRYASGDQVTVEADQPGMTFIGWESEDVILTQEQSSQPHLTFIMPENDVTLIACYKEITDDDGDEEPEVVRYMLSVIGGTGDGLYEEGESATAVALPEEGWSFTGWTSEQMTLTDEQKMQTALTFDMPAMDVTLTANYEKNSTPAAAERFQLRVVNGVGDGLYEAGDRVTITAVAPKDDMRFVGWESREYSDLNSVNEISYTFEMPANDVTVTALYEKEEARFVLSVINGMGDGIYKAGTEVVVTASDAPSGWHFDRWASDGLDLTRAQENSREFRLTMPANDVTLTALYAQEPTDDPDDPSDKPDDDPSDKPDDDPSDKPDDDDPSDKPDDDDPLDGPEEDPDDQTYYSVTVINGTGDGVYQPGETVTVSLIETGDEEFIGWHFMNVEDEELLDDRMKKTFTFIMPARNVRIIGGFQFDEALHALVVVNGTGDGVYHEGDTVLVEAYSDDSMNAAFVRWESEDILLTEAQKTKRKFEMTMPGWDVVLTAVFEEDPQEEDPQEEKPYDVKVIGGWGSGEYMAGELVVIWADTPQLGMRFAGWTSDQMDLIKFYPDMTADMDMLAFYMPAGNVTITANYEPLPPMPPTGDDSSLPLWSALAAGSLCGMALLMRSRRRKARG